MEMKNKMFNDQWEREQELKHRTESIQSWAFQRQLEAQWDRPTWEARLLRWIGEDLIGLGAKLAQHFDAPAEQAPQQRVYHH